MTWAMGQSHKERLVKINKQLEILNSLTPSQYYEKEEKELLERKEIDERVIKLYENGTTQVVYMFVLEVPDLIAVLVKRSLGTIDSSRGIFE